MPQATLVNKQGKKIVVEAGTPQAQQYFKQGYSLMGAALPSAPTQAPQNDIASLLAKVNSQQQDYQNSLTSRQGFADALKQKLAEIDAPTQAIQAEQRAQQEGQYNIPNTLREQLIAQGITDPFARQKLIDQRLGAANSNISALSQLLANRGARNQDILQSAQGVYGDVLQAKQFGLQNLQKQLQDAQDAEAAKQAALAKQAADEQNFQQQIYLKQLEASLKPKSSGGGSRSSGGLTAYQQAQLSAQEKKDMLAQQAAQDKYLQQYNAALNSGADKIKGINPKGGGFATQEQFAQGLARQFPALDPNSILEDVKAIYPQQQQQKTGIINSLKNFFGL